MNLIPLFRNYNEDSNEEEDEEESEEEDSDEEEDEEEDNYYKAMGHSCEYEDSHMCHASHQFMTAHLHQGRANVLILGPKRVLKYDRRVGPGADMRSVFVIHPVQTT